MLKMMAAVAATVIWAGGATAGDLYYPTPGPSGDPIYGGSSMVIGDLYFSGGTLGGSTLGGTGGGRVLFNLRNGWNLQGEVAAVSNGTLVGFGHLFTRLPSAVVGVFGGVGVVANSGTAVVGVEGEIPLSHDLAIGGSLAYYANIGGGSGTGVADLYAAYYFTPQTKIRGDVIWRGASGAGFAGGIYHQFNNSPVVGFARIGFMNSNTTIQAGVNIMFNDSGKSLKDHYGEMPLRAGIPLSF